MGDMADYYISQFPAVWQEERDKKPCDYFPVSRTIQCRYCKEGGLNQFKTDKGWRLRNSKGIIHNCLNSEIK